MQTETHPAIIDQMATLKERHEQNMRSLERLILKKPQAPSSGAQKWVPESHDYREEEVASYEATRKAIPAFERLLRLEETRNSGQISRIAQFLAGIWGVASGFKTDCLFSLDKEIGDDMLSVLDGIRWCRVAVCEMAPNARQRVPAALVDWGYDLT